MRAMNVENSIALPEYILDPDFIKYIISLHVCDYRSDEFLLQKQRLDSDKRDWAGVLYTLILYFKVKLQKIELFYQSLKTFYKRIIRVYIVSPGDFRRIHETIIYNVERLGDLKEEVRHRIIYDIEGLSFLPNAFVDHELVLKKYCFRLVCKKVNYLFVISV